MSTSSYLLTGVRTPIGKFLGGLSSFPAPELAAITLREALARTGFSPAEVDEVILGQVLQAGSGQAPARQAALKSGLPTTIPAVTINKVCGSGLKSVMLADQAIRCGDARLILAGGMESMSRAPFLLRGAREGLKFGNANLEDSMIADGLWCAFEGKHMGNSAEHTASTCGISRGDQDQFAVDSQQKAAKARAAGLFRDEIVPVSVKSKAGETVISEDEGPRPDTSLAGLSKLRPAFLPDGTVTAGNSSMLSDGAAALVVANEEFASRAKTPWKARILASHTSGVEPKDIFIAPITAVQGALKKARLSVSDIDLFELNEAFASQMLACARGLELDPAKVNVNGGAIALGHPIGASGARVLVTLLWALHQRNLCRGVASLCLGGGNAVAIVVERV